MDPSAKYTCVSIVYTRSHKICDLFAHKGNVYPARLVVYAGIDYLEFKPETCDARTPQPDPDPYGSVDPTAGSFPSLPVPSLPFLPASPIGIVSDQCTREEATKITKYILTRNFGVDGLISLGAPARALNLADCAFTCTGNRDCFSFTYSDDSGDCELFLFSRSLACTATTIEEGPICSAKRWTRQPTGSSSGTGGRSTTRRSASTASVRPEGRGREGKGGEGRVSVMQRCGTARTTWRSPSGSRTRCSSASRTRWRTRR